MNDVQDDSATPGDIPEPDRTRRPRWQISLIWLVPLLAALIGLSLVVGSWMSKGPHIVISFQDAQGITAGKTEVKYKNVVIGKVSNISLSRDRRLVLVGVDLDKNAATFATQGSRFWVVRPRVGAGGVSGLGTLLSGPYIGADTGGSTQRQTQFKGLETPPPLTHNESGGSFYLTTDNLGSLDIGSPVYYRRIQVGRVVAYHLDDDGKGVTIQVFIKAPDDKFVTTDTHFWNASGINVSLSASGLKVDTQSLVSLVSGGIAFQTPGGDGGDHAPAPTGSRFKLFDDKETAMQPADGPPLEVRMSFQQSIRGLAVGAPVDFLGVDLGTVTKVSLSYDPETKRFPAQVTAVVYPKRIGAARQRFVKRHGTSAPGTMLAALVKHGLRAQLRTANLLTGQVYVAMDFFPKAPHAKPPTSYHPLEMPTVPGSFDKLQQQLADIVDEIHAVPITSMGRHLDDSLAQLDKLLGSVNKGLAPQTHATLEQLQTTMKQLRKTLATMGDLFSGNSPLGSNMGQTMVQMQRAARALRTLSDYLSRHPEALLRGRHDATAPAQVPAPAPRKPAGSQP